MSDRQVEDLVIVGAGPAGLAAAAAAAPFDPLILEAGPEIEGRDQDDPFTAAAGVGGAGLFSDGKFSFFPSATKLWSLDFSLLRTAYEWLTDSLLNLGFVAPDYPTRQELRSEKQHLAIAKKYQSIYLPLDARRLLLKRLCTARRIRTNAKVVRLKRQNGIWNLHLGSRVVVHARRVVLATGRLGPILAQDSLANDSLTWRRLEVGVRITQRSDEFFLREHPQLDPKYIWRGANVEWRTFCCCRDGKIVTTESDGLLAVSGRADCAPTGTSNVGFNVRLMDPVEASACWSHIRKILRLLDQPVTTGLATFCAATKDGSPNELTQLLGHAMSARLVDGVGLLVQEFGQGALHRATLTGPAVEGVGVYPVHDHFLATREDGLWVAGDVCGDFRGLTAALLSGYLVGKAVTKYGDVDG